MWIVGIKDSSKQSNSSGCFSTPNVRTRLPNLWISSNSMKLKPKQSCIFSSIVWWWEAPSQKWGAGRPSKSACLISHLTRNSGGESAFKLSWQKAWPRWIFFNGLILWVCSNVLNNKVYPKRTRKAMMIPRIHQASHQIVSPKLRTLTERLLELKSIP